jgi:polyisoprenoid-binding protein YceI
VLLAVLIIIKNKIMKLISLLVCTLAITFFSTVDTAKIDVDKSAINWSASKVTGKHNGSIKLSDGNLEFTDNQLSGGTFTMNMTTINVTDLKGGPKEKLEGHLNSPDFFSVEEHPNATFVITKVAPRGTVGEYKITGDMTIKGMTKEVRFNANIADGTASATIELDRTDYNVKYGSGSFFSNLGDKTIYDEFILDVNLIYSK